MQTLTWRYKTKTNAAPTLTLVALLQVGVDMANFPSLKDDLDFVERLISEESVFCLPGKVSSVINLLIGVYTDRRQFTKINRDMGTDTDAIKRGDSQ